MATITEAIHSASQLRAGLDIGLKTLDLNQTVEFIHYKRLVLPLDGFVFWVRADLLSDMALFNSSSYDTVPFNQQQSIQKCAKRLCVQGSLHFTTEREQKPDSTESINRVIFTTLTDINELNRIDPMSLWIGEFRGMRFAFSEHAKFYQQADLFHYQGDAVYPTMQTQLIDKLEDLDTRQLIVSNSLPFWLSLNLFYPIFPYPSSQGFPLFPSDLVPNNIRPPYGSVDIPPEKTTALQMVPRLNRYSDHWQVAQDTVKITFYGLNNNLALGFQDYVNWNMLNVDKVGLMNLPIMQDEKKTQEELSVIAQKKSITYKVSYNQHAMFEIARQLITQTFVDYHPLELTSANFTLQQRIL